MFLGQSVSVDDCEAGECVSLGLKRKNLLGYLFLFKIERFFLSFDCGEDRRDSTDGSSR